MRTLIFACCIAAVVALGASGTAGAMTLADQLAIGKQSISAEDQQTRDAGIAALEEVIMREPSSPEAGEANYRLGLYYQKDRARALTYFSQAYSIANPYRFQAGISVGHTLVAMGRKLEAASAFEDVAAKYPAEAKYACYRAGMCYLGVSRGDAQPAALRDKAKDLFAKSATAGNLEAKLQLLGMRWEDCDAGKAKWGELIPDLEAYARNPEAPAYARARALLMIAERSLNNDDNQNAIEYADEVLATEFKGCRAEQAWATMVKAGALAELERTNDAIELFDSIHSRFTDADNFGGNNVRAAALYYKSELLRKNGRQDEALAVMDQLRQEYPDCKFLRPPGDEK